MFNRLADLVRLRAYADLLVQPVSRAAATSLGSLLVGTQVVAHVEFARADGSVRAAIDGQPFDLKLPFRARAGDNITLRVTAREPQLRFMFEPAAETAPRAASLSETARFITALLAESEKLPLAPVASAGVPLLDDAPTDSREIARVLQNALADSGMFYEAHQAQWVAEQRPLAALMREPQSQLAPLPAADETATVATDLPQLKELPVHRDALTAVRQQLETLETRQVVWQGTLWPGQTIEWEVGEEARQARADDDETREWRSRLRLTLPRLGSIDATLVVSARGVRMNLSADSAEIAHTLEQNRRSLRDALGDAGITPLAIGVAVGAAHGGA
jgi:hypothetical protein